MAARKTITVALLIIFIILLTGRWTRKLMKLIDIEWSPFNAIWNVGTLFIRKIIDIFHIIAHCYLRIVIVDQI